MTQQFESEHVHVHPCAYPMFTSCEYSSLSTELPLFMHYIMCLFPVEHPCVYPPYILCLIPVSIYLLSVSAFIYISFLLSVHGSP